MATLYSKGDQGCAVFAVAFGVAAGSLIGCVDVFDGANVQVDFSEGTQLPATAAGETAGAQPWADTYFTFYAIDNVYKLDENGAPELDDDGRRIVTRSYVFALDSFEIRRAVNLSSPCFIELEESRFPGLHSTRYLERLGDDTGIEDPFNAPDDAAPGDVIDMLGAQVRIDSMSKLQGQVKALTSLSQTFEYPEPGTVCAGEGGFDDTLIPPADCIDDASNAVRIAVCKALWAENEDFYEGNDKVLTLPHNGSWRGVVTGTNPINQGFLSGSSFFVDRVLTSIDALTVNWQFKDRDQDGDPDYPADFPDELKSPVGVIYLRGDAELDTRGVINVPMFNPEEPNIRAEAAIFANLGVDDVHF